MPKPLGVRKSATAASRSQASINAISQDAQQQWMSPAVSQPPPTNAYDQVKIFNPNEFVAPQPQPSEWMLSPNHAWLQPQMGLGTPQPVSQMDGSVNSNAWNRTNGEQNGQADPWNWGTTNTPSPTHTPNLQQSWTSPEHAMPIYYPGQENVGNLVADPNQLNASQIHQPSNVFTSTENQQGVQHYSQQWDEQSYSNVSYSHPGWDTGQNWPSEPVNYHWSEAGGEHEFSNKSIPQGSQVVSDNSNYTSSVHENVERHSGEGQGMPLAAFFADGNHQTDGNVSATADSVDTSTNSSFEHSQLGHTSTPSFYQSSEPEIEVSLAPSTNSDSATTSGTKGLHLTDTSQQLPLTGHAPHLFQRSDSWLSSSSLQTINNSLTESQDTLDASHYMPQETLDAIRQHMESLELSDEQAVEENQGHPGDAENKDADHNTSNQEVPDQNECEVLADGSSLEMDATSEVAISQAHSTGSSIDVQQDADAEDGVRQPPDGAAATRPLNIAAGSAVGQAASTSDGSASASPSMLSSPTTSNSSELRPTESSGTADSTPERTENIENLQSYQIAGSSDTSSGAPAVHQLNIYASVIGPRDGSPFRPLKSAATIPPVIQHETPDSRQPVPPSSLALSATQDQGANLEMTPDNVERPGDLDAFSGEVADIVDSKVKDEIAASIRESSLRGIRDTFNDSPSATLWQNPEPKPANVILVPATSTSSVQQNVLIVPHLSDQQAVLDNPLGKSPSPLTVQTATPLENIENLAQVAQEVPKCDTASTTSVMSSKRRASAGSDRREHIALGSNTAANAVPRKDTSLPPTISRVHPNLTDNKYESSSRQHTGGPPTESSFIPGSSLCSRVHEDSLGGAGDTVFSNGPGLRPPIPGLGPVQPPRATSEPPGTQLPARETIGTEGGRGDRDEHYNLRAADYDDRAREGDRRGSTERLPERQALTERRDSRDRGSDSRHRDYDRGHDKSKHRDRIEDYSDDNRELYPDRVDPRYPGRPDPRYPDRPDPRYPDRPDPRYPDRPDSRNPERTPDPRYPDRVADPRYPDRTADPRYTDRTADPRYPDRTADPRYPDRTADPLYPDRTADPLYPDRVADPRYPDRVADPRYPDRVADPRYPDRAADPRYQDRPTDPRYPDRTIDPRYPDKAPDPRYPDRPDPRYPDLMDNRRDRYSRYDDDPRYYPQDRDRSRPSSRGSVDYDRERYYQSQGSSREREPQPYEERPHSRGGYDSDRDSGYYKKNSYDYRADYYRRDPRYRDRGADYSRYEQERLAALASMNRQYYGDPYYGGYTNYSYGYYDELYRSNPQFRQQYDSRYNNYYAQYQYDSDRRSVQSGRSSVNDEIQKSGDKFSQDFHQPNVGEQINGSQTYDPSAIYHDYSPAENNYYYQGSSSQSADASPSVPAPRLTPAKFQMPHVRVQFTATGQLVKVLPNAPTDGQPAVVEIHDLQRLLEENPEIEELKKFPGPLMKGQTHKNDVIQFCLDKVKVAHENFNLVDQESYILIWDLLNLLVRQNGTVVGTDIAELLLKDHECITEPASSTPAHLVQSVNGDDTFRADTISSDDAVMVTKDRSVINKLSEESVTRKFREYLLFGRKKEALEKAMKNGLWGHALFLASKMDNRTYANVMTRFANSLALNDPLQTLYQLMSGRQPAAVTCVAEEKWGDWRPHLAMILSNTSQRPELDRRSIATFGDTLAARGCLHAAQFCYLMAQLDFGTYSSNSSKLVLLTSNHSLPFNQFATNEAIQCTEVYEYAQSLANPHFMLPHFQSYRFIYATRLAEYGFPQEALHYCEVISSFVCQMPALFHPTMVTQVYELANRLKYYDPHYASSEGENSDLEDPAWLIQLNNVLQAYSTGMIESMAEDIGSYSYMTNSNANLASTTSEAEEQTAMTQMVPSSTGPSHETNFQSQTDLNQAADTSYTGYQYSSATQPQKYSYSNRPSQDSTEGVPLPAATQNQQIYYGEHNNYDTTYSQGNMSSQVPPYYPPTTADVGSPESTYNDSNQQDHSMQEDYWDMYAKKSSPPDSPLKPSPPTAVAPNNRRPSTTSNKSQDKADLKRDAKQRQTNVSSGWLGGIFSKLMPKPKNQMKLPDDRNPTIVWDPKTNRWMNTDEDEEDSTSGPAAPPTDSEILGTGQSSMATSGFTAPPAPFAAGGIPEYNKFRRPGGLGARNQHYVDVLAKNKASASAASLPPGFLTAGEMQTNVASPQLFIPAAVPESLSNDYNEYNSNVGQPQIGNPGSRSGSPHYNGVNTVATAELSRSSSQSSLSREVQHYMAPSPADPQQPVAPTMPMMFNPSQLQAPTVPQVTRGSRLQQYGRRR